MQQGSSAKSGANRPHARIFRAVLAWPASDPSARAQAPNVAPAATASSWKRTSEEYLTPHLRHCSGCAALPSVSVHPATSPQAVYTCARDVASNHTLARSWSLGTAVQALPACALIPSYYTGSDAVSLHGAFAPLPRQCRTTKAPAPVPIIDALPLPLCLVLAKSLLLLLYTPSRTPLRGTLIINLIRDLSCSRPASPATKTV